MAIPMGLVVSMTGYGRGEARGARVALIAEARSLNHRFLETSVKLPRASAGTSRMSAGWSRGGLPAAGWMSP